MAEIRLTPTNSLRWETVAEPPAEPRAAPLSSPAQPPVQPPAAPPADDPLTLATLRDQFAADWRQGLFALAARKIDPGASLSLRYWQGIAENFLTRLCHLPSDASPTLVPPPSEAECAEWALMAPPIQGGEYLSAPTLLSIWDSLTQWCDEAVRDRGPLDSFLEQNAPKWHQVGRVCFHLAENKLDPDRPFAFMATYVSGLGATGRLRHLPLRQALEQYAGTNNRPALVKLLSPVHRAAQSCDWVRAMVESGEIYTPLAWTAEQAYRLLLSVPALEDSGLTVRLPDWWQRRARPRVSVQIGSQTSALLGLKAMLDFNVGVALGDETLSPEEIQALLDGGDGLVLLKGQWVEVDREKLQEAIAHWESLREEAAHGEISFIEGMRLLAGATEDLKHDEKAEATRPRDPSPACFSLSHSSQAGSSPADSRRDMTPFHPLHRLATPLCRTPNEVSGSQPR